MKTPIILSLMAFLLAVINPLWGQITPIGFKAFQEEDSLYIHIVNESEQDTLIFATSFVLHNDLGKLSLVCGNFASGIYPRLLVYTISPKYGETHLQTYQRYQHICPCKLIETPPNEISYHLAPKDSFKIAIPISFVLLNKDNISDVFIECRGMFTWRSPDPPSGVNTCHWKHIHPYLVDKVPLLKYPNK